MSFQLAPSISVLRIMRDGAWAWAVLLGVGVVEGGWGVAGRDGDGDGDGGGNGEVREGDSLHLVVGTLMTSTKWSRCLKNSRGPVHWGISPAPVGRDGVWDGGRNEVEVGVCRSVFKGTACERVELRCMRLVWETGKG